MPKNQKTASSQKNRFIEAARQLGCDESEKSFEDKLRRIAKPSAPKKAEKKKTLAK